MVFVFMARVRSFKRVGAGIYFQDKVHDVPQRSVVDAGPFIDSITGVEADLFRRDSPQRVVERFDRSFGDLPSRRETQRWILAMDFRKPGIVDLQDEAGINDRLILGSKSVADCLQVFFVAAVIFVGADPTGRYGRPERLLG